MIYIILTILTAAGPLGQLRSEEPFATAEACAAAIAAEAPQLARLQSLLVARLGRPVRIDARCVDLSPGTPA